MRSLISYSFMIIWLFLSVNTLNGQEEYYSKVIKGYNDETFFWDMNYLEDSGDIFLTTTRSGVGYVNAGWSKEGVIIDSFFYERNSLVPTFTHPMAVKGDTVFQLLRFINDTDLVQVHGSSLSQKDSLFAWTYDFSHLNKFRRVDASSCMINSDGNLVITGTYSIESSPFNTKHIFFMEVDGQGNVLNDKSVMDVTNTYGFEYYSRIVEVGEHYYACLSLHPRESNTANNYILKIHKEGNKVWLSEEAYVRADFQLSSLQKAEVSHSEERSEIYVVNNHALEFRDFPGMDYESDEFFDSVAQYSHMKIIVSVYDMESGTLLRDYSLMAPKNTLEKVFSSVVSKINGDLVIIGQNKLDVPDHAFQWNAGFFIRMNPVSGEFMHHYKVLDQFGHPHVFGNNFTDLAEDEAGNVYIAGQVNNFVFGSKQPAGWLVKLGIDPCEGMHCRRDTLSGHTFLTSLQNHIINKTQYLEVFPNPIKAGGTISISFDSGQFPRDISRIRILNNSGQVVQELNVDDYERSGLLQLPQVAPGMYYVEMLKPQGRERYVGKVVVY